MRATRLALCAALLAGCGGSSADPKEGADDLAGALCDLSFRCCTAGDVHYFLGHYVTPDDCADRLVNSAQVNTAFSFSLGLFEDTGVFLPNLAALDEAV